MRHTVEQLDRKIRTQELVCMVNGWLLEHYEKQRELLEAKNENKKGVRADQDMDPQTLPRQGA